ncbi:MAG: ABC transporter transmembrane domain-containing protein, partial [Acidimicrobiales bacterium]
MISYLKPYRSLGLLAFVCAAGLGALTIVPALVLRALVDDLERRQHSFAGIALVVVLGVVAIVGSGLLGVAQTYISARIGKGVVAEVRGELFDHLVGQSVGFFAKRRVGELMSRILNDVGGIDALIGPTIPAFVGSLFTLAASLALMFVLSWQLSVITVALLPLIVVVVRVGSHSIYVRGRAVQEQFAGVTAYLQEVLGPAAIMLVKSFGREHDEKGRFAAVNEKMRRLEISSSMAGRWTVMTLSIIRLAGPVAILLVGSYLVVHHVTSLGNVVGFATIAMMGFSASLQSLSTSTISLVSSMPMWVRIFEVLDERAEVTERPDARALSDARGAVTVEDVTFSYPG